MRKNSFKKSKIVFENFAKRLVGGRKLTFGDYLGVKDGKTGYRALALVVDAYVFCVPSIITRTIDETILVLKSIFGNKIAMKKIVQ